MFLSSAFVMILTQIIGLAAIIIDGIITSRVLGNVAYSAISLLQPFISIVLMLAGFLSVGNQIVCSKLVGKGKKREANEVFSASTLTALALSALLLVFCVFFPDTLLKVCGVSVDKHPDFYLPMIDYLKGYMLSIPALILIQIMGPVIVLDSNKALFTASSVVLCVTDVIGDLLNVFVLDGGTFGMGVATTVAFYVQALILLTHFFRKKAFFRLFRKPSLRVLREVGASGLPALITRLATALRNLFISRFNLAVALTAAGVAAKGIQGDISNLMFCFSLGLGRAMSSLSSLHYGANDRSGLKRLFKFALKATLIITLTVSGLVFFASPLIAGIYTSDPEVTELAIFGICCMAVGLVFDALATIYMDFLQGTGKRKLVNVLVFFERFFVPIVSALILGLRFGSKGVLASLALSKLLMIIVIVIAICIYRKKVIKSPDDFLLLPEDFGGATDNNLYAHIETMDDVMRECADLEKFCLRHKTTDRVAKNMALALEELAGNVVAHGKKTKRKEFGIDYRAVIDEEDITLTIRDLCGYFDPLEWSKAHGSDDSEKGIGLRIITGLAKDVRYFNAFNSNNIIFTIDRRNNETE